MKIALVLFCALSLVVALVVSEPAGLSSSSSAADATDDVQKEFDSNLVSPVEYGNGRKKRQAVAVVLPSTLTKAMGALGKGSGFVSGILGIFDFIFNKVQGSQDDTSRRILEGVNEIKDIAKTSKKRLDFLIVLSQLQHLRTDLSESRLKIKGSFDVLSKYLATGKKDSYHAKLNRYDDILHENIKQVYDYLLGDGHDALEALHAYHMDNRVGFLEDAGMLLSLAAEGVFVELALTLLPEIYKTAGKKQPDKSSRDQMKIDYSELERKAKARIREYEGKYDDEAELRKKIKDWLEEYEGKSFKEMADILRDKLSERWDQKSWLVAVYTPFTGGDMHWIRGGDLLSGLVMRERGYTVLATSFDAKKSRDVKGYDRKIRIKYCPVIQTVAKGIWLWSEPYIARRRRRSPHSGLGTAVSWPKSPYPYRIRRCENYVMSASVALNELINEGYVPDWPRFSLAVIKDKNAAFSMSYLMNPLILNSEWKEWKGHWFWDSTFKLNWKDARNFCKDVLSGDLAVLSSDEKHDAVNGMFQTYQKPAIWHWRHIGLRRNNPTGPFSWVDGTAVTYNEFSPPQPVNGSACAIAGFCTGMGLNVVKSWQSWPCTSNELHFVCERSPSRLRKAEPDTKQPNRTRVSTSDSAACFTAYDHYKKNGIGPLVHRHMPSGDECPFESSLCYGLSDGGANCVQRQTALSIIVKPQQ